MVKNKRKKGNNVDWVSKKETWKKGAIVGGVWGGISAFYGTGILWVAGEYSLNEMVIFFPSYLAYVLTISPFGMGKTVLPFFLYIALSILFGVVIIAGGAHLIDKIKE